MAAWVLYKQALHIWSIQIYVYAFTRPIKLYTPKRSHFCKADGLFTLSSTMIRLALLGPPVGDDVSAVGVVDVEGVLAPPGVEEPANVVGLEVGAVVVKGLPVVGVLSAAQISVSGVVLGRTPSPLSLSDPDGQANVGLDPVDLRLDVAPGLGLGLVEVVEGHGVDVSNIRVGLDTGTDGGESLAVVAAHDAGSVPILADADQNSLLVESGAELAKVVDKVALVHTVTNGLRAELSPVNDIRGNSRDRGVVDGIVDGLLGLLPDGLNMNVRIPLLLTWRMYVYLHHHRSWSRPGQSGPCCWYKRP